MSSLVSIIVPNFNHSKYLEQRLQSVFNQSFQDFEVILLDDCSTDDSVAILSGYSRHPKVTHLVVNEVNSGSPFRQWKKGAELAQGEIIWIAESDDWADVHFLETLVPKFRGQVGLVYCRSQTYLDSTGELPDHFFPEELDPLRWRSDYLGNGKEEIENYLLYRNTIPNASGVLFKKEIAHFDDAILSMSFCGDWVFWSEILMKSDVYFVSERLNFFRFSDNTSRAVKDVKREEKRYNEYFYCINRISEKIGKNMLPPKKYEWMYSQLFGEIGFFKIFRVSPPPIPIRSFDFFLFLFKRFFARLSNRWVPILTKLTGYKFIKQKLNWKKFSVL